MKILFFALSLFMANPAWAAKQLTSEADVTAAFARHRPMVIMFYTDWCPACKATKPEFLKAEKALHSKKCNSSGSCNLQTVDFYFMNVDQISLGGPDPADRKNSAMNIRAIPSFSVGNTEAEVRAGKHFREGGGDVNDLLQFIKSSLKLK